jgi:hypothetical protein
MCEQTITTISSVIVALATGVGVVIAAIGLSTWKKQLQGTAEYELAKRLLLSVYKVREAVAYVRQPFLSVAEAGEVKEGEKWEVVAYTRRWKKVQDAMSEFQDIALESEVVWGGKDIIRLQNSLMDKVRTLLHAVDSYIRSVQDPAFKDDYTREQRDTLYSMGANDSYGPQFTNVIKDFEKYVAPHIKAHRESLKKQKSDSGLANKFRKKLKFSK